MTTLAQDAASHSAAIKAALLAHEAVVGTSPSLLALHNALNGAAIALAGHLGANPSTLGATVNPDGGTNKN